MSNPTLSLAELNNLLRDIIEANFPEELWVVAEISELNVNARGHCYIDLIERDELSKKIIARQRGTVWAFQYRLVKGHFESITGQELTSGLKVLVKVRVNYHVLYGLSLNVVDIDPTYTIGDQARHRELILQQLEEDGVLDMNKEMALADVPQRVAVISSETAAGYGDFVEHLTKNPYGYQFTIELFAASMQGEQTSPSVVAALEAVYNREEEFHAVLIIRGGGAKAELVAFDDYNIAFMVSQSPIPVLTGIGHERDQSVTDMVAWQAFKTPTAVADFLLEKMAAFEQSIDNMASVAFQSVRQKLEQSNYHLQQQQAALLGAVKTFHTDKRHALERFASQTGYAVDKQMQLHKSRLKTQSATIKQAVFLTIGRHAMQFDKYRYDTEAATRRYFSEQYHKLSVFQEIAMQNRPEKLLKGGYGYVTRNGHRVASVDQLAVNDEINIAFIDGVVGTRVVSKSKKDLK
ncbi:MAG: exodeoxyribonuclease VII large subunit [Salinivirgaceae bacterium]